jgi:cyclase
VIDTFSTTEAATRLLASIRQLTPLPVRFVVNTHYHVDHVVGNGVFSADGAAILAQRNVRSWIHSENLRIFGPQITPEWKATIDDLVAPTVVYDQAADVYLGAREIRIRSFPGHTGGDSIVMIPDAKVVFAGDLFNRDMLPSLTDGSIEPWIGTLDTLARNDPEYTFVPGHGDVGTAQDIAASREYLVTLRSRVEHARAEGKSGDELAAMVIPTLREKYGHWDYFEAIAKRSVLEIDAELSGTKRVPPLPPSHP